MLAIIVAKSVLAIVVAKSVLAIIVARTQRMLHKSKIEAYSTSTLCSIKLLSIIYLAKN